MGEVRKMDGECGARSMRWPQRVQKGLGPKASTCRLRSLCEIDHLMSMDKLMEHPSTGSSDSVSDPCRDATVNSRLTAPPASLPDHSQDAPGYSSLSVPAPPGGVHELAHRAMQEPTIPTATSQTRVQIVRTGGIGLTTTAGDSQTAAFQEKLRYPTQSVVAPRPPITTASSHQVPIINSHGQETLQPIQPAHREYSSHQQPAWDVPNPLLGGAPGSPERRGQRSQQQLQGMSSKSHSHATSDATTVVFQRGVPVKMQENAAVQPRQVAVQPYSRAPIYAPGNSQHQHAHQHAQHQRQRHQHLHHGHPMQQQQQQQQEAPPRRPKVVLSAEAKAALAKAIWSAIRSPDGSIAPDLMQAAMATGLPQNAVLNAARVARDREAQKRQSMHQQAPPQRLPSQSHHHSASSSTSHQPHQYQQEQKHQSQSGHSSHVVHQHQYNGMPGAKPPPVRTALPIPPSNIPRPVVSAKSVTPTNLPKSPVTPKAKPAQNTQQVQAAKVLQIRTDERAKWKRVHQGIFLVQKGKFMAPPHTICGIVRSGSDKAVVTPPGFIETGVSRKRHGREVLLQVVNIQKLLQAMKQSPITPLLEPDKFKRIKIEAKKHSKALERVVRRARQTAAEALNKQHKEFSKSIASHQQDFFKFHKQRRADASKVAKMIRDNFDKESKKKEKEGVAAERARLAALKANDMDAYSRLLEETKNERLKFLMDKTEKHFSQISTSLLQHRNKDGSVASTGGTASYYASAHLKTEEVRQPSILIGGDLKEYQMGGLQWLVSLYNNKLNGILADEMGLGKTIQAISLIAYLMEIKNNLGPYLVVVPLSTLSNWVNEFHKWCPSAHVICYKGTPGQRKEVYRDQVKNGHFNVLLTTYEYIIKDKANLRKITWQYAIVDEGHRMKNSASKFAKTLSTQYTTKFRLLLTGTPLMNDLGELWSLLNFLLPSIFNSVDTFDQWFNRPFAQFGSSNDDENNNLSNEERMFIIHRLHELLRPFMLRRVKSEVLDQLPEKVEKILRCELSSWQKELYKQISKKAVVENGLLGNSFAQPQPASRGLNNVVMQLRKVCNHPYLFASQGYQINENIIRSSGKLDLLDRMLPKLRAAGHRVLMFTQMTAVMTILEDYFAYRGFLSLRLDGSTPAEEREKRMYKFNSPDSPYFIFLLSTRAGGLGLNLTAANTVIIFDSDWNPMMDLQAQDRAHRIGQRSDVSVFRLVTHSPVEEKILSRATEKLNMSELVVEAGQFDKRSLENDNSLERKKLMEVLLTDFDSNTYGAKATTEDKAQSEMTGSDAGDEDDDDDDNGSDSSREEDLNDLLSNNESDYQLYKAIDKEKESNPCLIDTSLFTSEEDIPDWVKYPTGRKNASAVHDDLIPGSGPRKRKEVMYDDGLTEKQFMRMMDKQHDAEILARENAKQVSRTSGSTSSNLPLATATPIPGSELTDWTFRKLISCTKAVITLKDPSTKRRLSDIFMEKPTPEQFPDYYEIIQKPIAINDILRKCRAKLYASMREYRDDWKLMFSNAKTFNGQDSWVVKDGEALEKELERLLKKNGFGEEAPKKPSPPKPKKLRIKLSLKTLKAKADEAAAEAKWTEHDSLGENSSTVPKKKRKIT